MGVIQDPLGAYVLVWQANQHIGAGLVNVPGALCWNELATADIDASTKFYSELFGWKIEPFEGMPMPYSTIQNAGRGNGGVRAPGPGEPPNWLVYFASDDVGASLAKVEELGGKKVAGPYDLGPMTLGIAQDPQSAVFALYAGQLED
jgi:predicted enzyme related to lactoylglutathione lyase